MKNVFYTVLIVMLWISTAFADGDSRRATADEKDFALRVMKVFESAVQKGPEGWEMMDRTVPKAPEYVTLGQEEYPMTVDYSIRWQDSVKVEASKSDTEQLLMKMAEEQNPEERMKAVMAEYEKVAEEFGKALNDKDMKKAEALQKKMEEMGKKINEQASENDKVFDEQIKEITPHDVELKIYINANVFYQDLPQTPSEDSVIGGCRVIRIDDEGFMGQAWHEGNTYIFAGDFEYHDEDGYAFMRAEITPDTPHTRVQTVIIHITGDSNRVKDLIRKIDLKSIKGLLGS